MARKLCERAAFQKSLETGGALFQGFPGDERLPPFGEPCPRLTSSRDEEVDDVLA